MKNCVPYTYLIGWSNENKFYYGVQYGTKIVVAHPDNLWTSYFTSSSEVSLMRGLLGEPDVIEVRRTFSSPTKAKFWEETVIRRMGMAKSEIWLNKGNAGSFKGIVMNEKQIELLKEGHAKNKGRKRVFYTNGVSDTWFFEDEIEPADGWWRGISETRKETNSKAQKRFYETIDPEVLKERGRLHSLKTKGVSKPEGFGEKVSKALTGIKRPYNTGDNNPSKTPEARRKISEARKSRKSGKWYNDSIENFWIYDGENVPELLVRGRVKRGPSGLKWFNDGCKEFKANPSEKQDDWNLGRLKNVKS